MSECNSLATEFFLRQQGWPSYILPISVLAGAFAYAQLSMGPMKPLTWLMVFLVVFFVYLVLQIVARMRIPENLMSEFVQRCERCKADPLRQAGPLTAEEVLSYVGKQEMHEGFDSKGKEVPLESAKPDTENVEATSNNTNAHAQVGAASKKKKVKAPAPGEQVSAPSMEQYADFAPIDVAFPEGKFPTLTAEARVPPLVMNDTNEVPSTPLVLTPGEIQEAQTLSAAPAVYNASFANYMGVKGSDEVAGFDPMPANKDVAETMCMATNSTCGTMCSGDAAQNAKCAGMVAPVPGPQWQPQRASVVQARLAAGNYVAATCPITH